MRRAGFPHRYDEAIQYCQRALLLEPNFLDALLLLALSYEQKGMLQESIPYPIRSHPPKHRLPDKDNRKTVALPSYSL